ncbi:MAG: hypothetical protein ABSE05_16300 [Syntrophales bacterium]
MSEKCVSHHRRLIFFSVSTVGEAYLLWTVASHAHYTIAVAYILLSGILLTFTGRTNR